MVQTRKLHLKKNAVRNKIRADDLEERVVNLEKCISVVTKDEEALFVQLDNVADFVELKTRIKDSATKKKLQLLISFHLLFV